jgi:hypothetical protein
MTKRADIVVTTIFEPRFLDDYVENLERHGHDDVGVIIIPDRKTPRSVYEAAAKHPGRVLCPDIDEQERFLAKFPSMAGRIPYDSDNRRNIGYLMALDRGAEVLISIDDDNFVLADSDFAGEHKIVGESLDLEELESNDRWMNLCALLESNSATEVFARGFPYYARRAARQTTMKAARAERVVMNVGLWLSDPDVDAITRLGIGPKMERFRGTSLLLGRDTWTPINTQNTAVARDAVAAYYYVRMGFALSGMKIDRYGDIFSGYFLQKCVKHRGEAIRIGTPIADHRRTPHNLFKDLYHELAGMVILDDLLPWLQELQLTGSSYRELYASLADALEEKGANTRGFVWDEGGGAFLRDTAAHMRGWLAAIEQIG